MKNMTKKLATCSIIIASLLHCSDYQETKSLDQLNQCVASPTPELKSRDDLLKLMPKNGIIAEIGVWDGSFSEKILKYCNPKKLYLIDCWANQSQEAYPDFLNTGFNNRYLENLYQSCF